MNTEVEKQINDCRERWFKNHVATLVTLTAQSFEGAAFANAFNPPNMLIWREPNSSNFSTRYIIYGNTLLVFGDIGEAAYCWSQAISWEFITGCDWHYFMGKCRASEAGRNFTDWDDKKAIDELKEYLEIHKPTKGTKSISELLEDAEGYAHNKHEWCQWIYNDECDEFGDDDHSLADAGEVPHCRGIGHWVGIKMAMEQLRKTA